MKLSHKIVRLVSLKRALKYPLFLLVILLLNFNSVGQNIDSLKLALKNAKHDTARCIILNMLVEVTSDEEWPVFNEQLKIVSEKNAAQGGNLKNIYLKHLANALSNMGYLADEQHDLVKQLDLFSRSLKIWEEIGDKQGIATSLNNLGELYGDKGEISEAMDYHQRSLKISKEIGDKRGVGSCLNDIAVIYDKQGDIQSALEFHHKSLIIKQEIGDKSGIAVSFNNIGYIYIYQGETTKALEYFLKCLATYKTIGDKFGTALCMNNIASVYVNLGNQPKALEYMLKSLATKQEIGDKEGIAFCLSNVGTIYEKQGDISKAMDHYERSLKIREEIGDKFGMANSINNIANLEFSKGDIQRALVFGNRSMAIGKELGFPFVILNSAETLKRIFNKQKKYKEAFEMYELEIKMRDSIKNEQTEKAVVKKLIQVEYEKKEAVSGAEHKIELKKQQAISDEKQRKQTIVIWSVVIGLILVIGFAGYVFKTLSLTRKQKLLIEIKSREVEQKQTEILDSIHYAKRIQTALMPSYKYITKNLSRLQSKG